MKNILLKGIREKRGLTQAQTAKKAGVSETNYQRIERGVQEPGVLTAILIADVLKVKTYKEFKALFGAATPGIEKKPDGNRAE